MIAEHLFNEVSQASLHLFASSCKSGMEDLLLEVRITAHNTDLGCLGAESTLHVCTQFYVHLPV